MTHLQAVLQPVIFLCKEDIETIKSNKWYCVLTTTDLQHCFLTWQGVASDTKIQCWRGPCPNDQSTVQKHKVCSTAQQPTGRLLWVLTKDAFCRIYCSRKTSCVKLFTTTAPLLCNLCFADDIDLMPATSQNSVCIWDEDQCQWPGWTGKSSAPTASVYHQIQAL